MKLAIINGPNLNLLGQREPEIYGNESFESYLNKLIARFSAHDIDYFQSNSEGELIDIIQKVGFEVDGIVINPAGYSHMSVSIADAMAAVPAPVVEVHISNIYARESFRQKSITGKNAKAVITGAGLQGYSLAIEFLTNQEG
ncbi:MAG: 3-dehydroquinate dehydratase [Salinivirgaceae bacterium]|nr:MAG: 3-dehydroquinate dehydratase [Salinivirgaceae bacterium]